MSKRVPIKGVPDFTNVSDKRLKEHIDLIQQLIFSYKGVSDVKVKMLREMWKEMSDEYADRLADSAIQEVSRQEESPKDIPVRRVKFVKPIRH